MSTASSDAAASAGGFSPDELAELVVKAASLHERLTSGDFVPVTGDGNDYDERWAGWAQSLSKQDPNQLKVRLALSGWKEDEVRPLLGRVRLRDGASLPGWTSIFQRAREEAADVDWDAAEIKKMPRGGFYLPFLRTARKLLSEKAGPLPEMAATDALKECEESLILRLCGVAEDAFFGHQGGARVCYERTDFFRTFPVAARRLSTVTGYWAEAIGEFFERLRADQTEIRERFGPGFTHITGLSGFASDSHCRGRAVIIVSGENGARLVYKPRSLGLEAAYESLVKWLNDEGTPVQLKAAITIDRGTYGWMEWIAPEECTCAEDVEIFYRRMGGLLAVSHAFAGGDLHFENLLAHGNHPVAIDTEVWMAPTLDKPEIYAGEKALQKAWQQLQGSVLSAAILPMWIPIGRDRAYNIGASESENGLLGVMTNSTASNLPIWQGQRMTPRAYRESILFGYRETYHFLCAQRDKLLGPKGPMTVFPGLPVRFVNRPTELYGRALRRSFNDQALRSGLTRSLQLEAFLKTALHTDRENQAIQLGVGSSEIRALERGDFPFFQGRVGHCDIYLPETGDRFPTFFSRNGHDVALERLEKLSPEDLASQTHFIVASYDLIQERPDDSDKPWTEEPVDFKVEAEAIMRTITELAVYADGTPAWVAPKEIAGGRFALSPLDFSFYDGTLGTMVFVLALKRVTGLDHAGELARNIFGTFARMVRHPLQATLRHSLTPGLLGLGGQIQGLCTAHFLCEDDRMLEVAEMLADHLTADSISQTAPTELLRGNVGLLAGLQALAAATGERRWRELAEKSLDHLQAAAPFECEGVKRLLIDNLSGQVDKSLRAVADQFSETTLLAADQFFSGNASQANVLITAAEKLNEPGYHETAARLMCRVTSRARANGGYVSYGNHAPSVSGPGFFQGLAGIGYTMLRLAEPSLPGILTDTAITNSSHREI